MAAPAPGEAARIDTLVKRVILRLRERGVFDDEETDRLIAELDLGAA